MGLLYSSLLRPRGSTAYPPLLVAVGPVAGPEFLIGGFPAQLVENPDSTHPIGLLTERAREDQSAASGSEGIIRGKTCQLRSTPRGLIACEERVHLGGGALLPLRLLPGPRLGGLQQEQ